MTAEIIIDEPWPRILRTIRQQEGKTVAAIAYVTKHLLELHRGDTLVCDASDGMVKAGQIDPKVLLAYLRKGVSVWSHPGASFQGYSARAGCDRWVGKFVKHIGRRTALRARRYITGQAGGQRNQTAH